MASQLVLTLSKGSEIIVGDHCVLNLISASGSQARLGFISRDHVTRVKGPETVVQAAKVKARVGQNIAPFRDDMKRIPVYVATAVDTDDDDPKPKIKAALSHENATYPDAQVMAVDATTRAGPSHHQFMVVRCATPPEAVAVRTLMNELGKPFLDEIELEDASLYLLFIHTVPEARTADVRYLDLAPMNGDRQ